MLSNAKFDVLDGYRLVDNVEGARFLAWRGADTPRELGKIVGGMKNLQGAAPLSPIHKIVPVGDDVVDRTTLVTEGNTAIHAARRLFGKDFIFWGKSKLPVIGDALVRRQ